MRFDVCLMNPPYGSKKSGLGPYIHFDFADICSKISDVNICVMPFRMMTSSSEGYNKFKESYNKTLVSVEEYPADTFNGTSMGNVGIYKFICDKQDTKSEILYLDKTQKITYNLLDLGIFSEYEVHIVKYIEAKKLNYNAFRPSKENKNNNKLIEFSNKYLKRFSDNQCFLTANLANGGMNGKFISGNAGKILRNKNELINEIIRTKGSVKVIMAFDNVHSAENCKAALMNPLMRFCLFKLQYDQSMTARVYKYVPDIDWEDDRVLTDEGLLEVCGCPKDKAKEYAEYCKKFIEENVDKTYF